MSRGQNDSSTVLLSQYIDSKRLYGRSGYRALDFRCRQMFRDVGPLKGRTMLDIGGGTGLFSAWAVANGAQRVANLEPELDGSAEGMLARFREIRGLDPTWTDRLIGREKTLQEYDYCDGPFDVVLSQSSINHLNESCCIQLQKSAQAWATYRGILQTLSDALVPGGWFVVSDAGSVNYWNRVGLTPPLAKSIEWHKHQEPEIWTELLAEVGFERVSLRWHQYYPMRALGSLSANRLVARLTSSKFIATFRKPAVTTLRRAAA